MWSDPSPFAIDGVSGTYEEISILTSGLPTMRNLIGSVNTTVVHASPTVQVDLRCSCAPPTSLGIVLSVTEVSAMTKPKDLVQGTLDLLILKIVALEPLHGWAIAHRIQQMSREVLQVGQSALYPALHKLEQQGWIEAGWKISETTQRPKNTYLTRADRRALSEEAANWERLSAAITAIVRTV